MEHQSSMNPGKLNICADNHIINLISWSYQDISSIIHWLENFFLRISNALLTRIVKHYSENRLTPIETCPKKGSMRSKQLTLQACTHWSIPAELCCKPSLDLAWMDFFILWGWYCSSTITPHKSFVYTRYQESLGTGIVLQTIIYYYAAFSYLFLSYFSECWACLSFLLSVSSNYPKSPLILTYRPLTNLCWECQDNMAMICRNVNLTESQKRNFNVHFKCGVLPFSDQVFLI